MAPRPTISLILTLRALPLNWGFTIYRTTYTPLSDQRFPHIIETISSYIKRSLLEEHASNMVHPYLTQPDRGTYEMLWNRYQPTIMDNQQKFNSLPLSSVRSHFEEWAEQQDINRVLSSQRRACLVIDDEVIDALADARPWIAGGMDDVLDFHQNSLRWWVKVVEAWPDLEETYDDYDGSMKASIFALWRLWKDIKDPEPTMASLPRNEENGGIYIP